MGGQRWGRVPWTSDPCIPWTELLAIFQAQLHSPWQSRQRLGTGDRDRGLGNLSCPGGERNSNTARACIKLTIDCEPKQGRQFLLLSG